MFQAKDVIEFCRVMSRHLRHRRGGLNAAGTRMGTDNQLLMDVMGHVMNVGNLKRIRASGDKLGATDIQRSVEHLVARRVIPPSCRTTLETVRAALSVIRNSDETDNQALLKVLYKAPELRGYVNLVCRLWLIHPTESVVESMASAVQEVFGVHRQMDHSNAAMELQVRWNGPDPFHADKLLRAVQAKHRFNFSRQSSNVRQALEGTVISRHKNNVKPNQAIFRYH